MGKAPRIAYRKNTGFAKGAAQRRGLAPGLAGFAPGLGSGAAAGGRRKGGPVENVCITHGKSLPARPSMSVRKRRAMACKDLPLCAAQMRLRGADQALVGFNRAIWRFQMGISAPPFPCVAAQMRRCSGPFHRFAALCLWKT